VRLLFGLLVFIASTVCLGEIPPEVRAVVEYQKKNKAAVIKSIQQEAMRAKKAGDADRAKALKGTEKDVRAGRVLWPPKYNPSGDIAGTIEVEKVLEKTDGGCWIQTSLPRMENSSVDVRTGLRGTNPMGMGWVYHPAKAFIETGRELRAGEWVFVRRSESGFAEVSAAEIEEATALLK